MKKKGLFVILLATTSMSLCGCNFFDIITSSSSEYSFEPISISGDGSKDKQQLIYNISDYVSNSFYSIANTPTIGNPKLLVLPILFTDSNSYLDEDDLVTYRAYLEKAFFGTKEETGWNSVKSFYEEESLGLCEIGGEVAPWYQSSYSYNSVSTSEITTALIETAVNNWKASNPNKVKEFDTNSDGFLDGVIAIYGGPDYKSIDKRERSKGRFVNNNMWAYTSWTSLKKDVNNPNVKNFIWASYDFMLNDISNVNVDTHTYIHEMGHMFGLDDYYDYNNSDYRWAGGFSMQDYNVGGHDPYSMLLYGWSNPYVPTETCRIEIQPFSTSKDLVLLTPEYTGSPYDEYLLVELYTPTGTNELDAYHAYAGAYPSGLTNAGIRLWHIDSRLLDVTNAKYTGYDHDDYYLFSNYTITTNVTNSHKYVVGPTNTQYSRQGSYNSYSTNSLEMRSFRLNELVRRNDYMGLKRGTVVDNSHLFRTGDTFSINNYENYFVKTSTSILSSECKFNNGKSFPWTISFDYVRRDKATITFTKNG